MKLIKLIIFVLAIGESKGFSRNSRILEKIPESDKSTKLAETALKILLSCYENEVNTVGAVGFTETIFHKILQLELSFSVISIDNNTTRGSAVNNGTVAKGSRYKLQLFVVEASSPEQLNRVLLEIKRTIWWNHMATYLIINWPSPNSEGCTNASEYLRTAWKRNLLNAMYVCLDNSKEEKLFVYSFNPYTDRAPVPWRLENTYKDDNGHPWTMFVREYHPARHHQREICKNLNFVKTDDLKGYPIIGSVVTTLPKRSTTARRLLMENRYFYNIIDALGATIHFKPYWSEDQLKIEPDKRRDIGMDIIEGRAEIQVNMRSTQNAGNFTLTSSHIANTGMVVIMQYKGQKSQLEKLLGVLDISTRYGICLVAVITLLFFKFFMRQPLGSAILNVIRIIGYTSLVKVPTKVAPRLYLTGVLILVVTIIGIYQGVIASLLTKPSPLRNVETMDDLIKSSYTVIGIKWLARYFTDPLIKDRFVGRDNGCKLDDILKDPSVACLITRDIAIPIAIREKLHMSQIIIPQSVVFVIREDWPLEDKFNDIIAKLFESHVTWIQNFKVNHNRLKVAEYHANYEKNRPCDVMKLEQLGFAFAFLGIGLSLATVAFIAEVAIYRFSIRFKNARQPGRVLVASYITPLATS